jgi:LmbE family N-acetylglucosaminyl deacetylase
MLAVQLAASRSRRIRILCVGAHSDDIEIGCGGTVLRLLSDYDEAEVHWVVLGSSGERDHEATVSAESFLAGARKKNVIVKNFRASFFPYRGEAVKDFFEELKADVAADVVFTHYRNDLHQDHRLVSELTWNTYRDHLILEYEIPKYDGDLGAPNFFVHLDEATCEKKIGLLMAHFQTQRDKDWFAPDVFRSLLRLRGVESRAPGRYAEGFYSRKLVL